MGLNIPLNAEELMQIVRRLREWERLLCSDAGDYKQRADIVTRIEITRPFSDGEGDQIGHFVLYDGWLGFEPIGDTNE